MYRKKNPHEHEKSVQVGEPDKRFGWAACWTSKFITKKIIYRKNSISDYAIIILTFTI